ncbi:hypothetical protein [Alloactinosynnema sp. L-07]|nr:hypothetical protein [Alloactinosynnema sp. L-07]
MGLWLTTGANVMLSASFCLTIKRKDWLWPLGRETGRGT